MVSPIPSLFSCASGLMYSTRIRSGLAGVLLRNFGSSCGAFGACCGLGFSCFADFFLPPGSIGQTLIVGTSASSGNASATFRVVFSTLPGHSRSWLCHGVSIAAIQTALARLPGLPPAGGCLRQKETGDTKKTAPHHPTHGCYL